MLSAAVTVALVAAGSSVVAAGSGDAVPAVPRPSANPAPVERGDLADVVSLGGILARRARPDGSPYTAVNQAHGIYTDLPVEGDKVSCGGVFYRVDDHPVLLLCGPMPAYRSLALGAHGRDVRQLNEQLHGLGYDRGAALGQGDDTFTWKTAAALKRLRRAKGLRVKGSLDLDDAVVLPRAVQVAKVTGQLGGFARPGSPVAQATSDTLEVQVNLEASQQSEVEAGNRAQIALPDNRSVKGTVDRLGRIARIADQDGAAATIPAFIRLDQPDRARGLDRAPVRVDIRTNGVRRVLSVPVLALVGRPGGGFAVEIVSAGGRRGLVAVKVGLFDTTAGRVQVEGELREGDLVAVPS